MSWAVVEDTDQVADGKGPTNRIANRFADARSWNCTPADAIVAFFRTVALIRAAYGMILVRNVIGLGKPAKKRAGQNHADQECCYDSSHPISLAEKKCRLGEMIGGLPPRSSGRVVFRQMRKRDTHSLYRAYDPNSGAVHLAPNRFCSLI